MDEYRALELYLQKAEEEIGLTFSEPSTPQTPVGDGYMFFVAQEKHRKFNGKLPCDLNLKSFYDDDPTPVNSPGLFCDNLGFTLSENERIKGSRNRKRHKRKTLSTSLRSESSVAVDDVSSGSDEEYHSAEEQELDLSLPSNKDSDDSFCSDDKDTSFHSTKLSGSASDEVFQTVRDQCNTPEFFPSVDSAETIIYQTLKEHKALRRSNTAPISFDSSRFLDSNFSLNDTPNVDSGYNALQERNVKYTGVPEFLTSEHISSHRKTKRSFSTTGVQTYEQERRYLAKHGDAISSKSVSRSTNTTDSLERPKKRNKSLSDVEIRSTIQKPTSFPQKLVSHQNMGCFIDDKSPEMQMLVSTTSPVLLRRKPTNRGKFRPRLHDDIYSNSVKLRTHDDMNGLREIEQEIKHQEDSYNKKDIAKTWDGMTVNKWKKSYAPLMKSMLHEMNNNNGKCSNGNVAHNLDIGSRTMPNKSLLDTMHKKYCAYQYKNREFLTPEDHNATLPVKFKSSPPPPDRMKSRSWLLQHYTIPSNLNSGSSSSPDSPNDSPRIRHQAKGDNSDSNNASIQDKAPQLLVNKADGTSVKETTVHNGVHEEGSPQTSECNTRETTPTPNEKSATGEKPVTLTKDSRPIRGEDEIEAVEACRWLKEAGFPQYAQMYEDAQFPVDVSAVEKEHDFLDRESMQPLVRRLSTLNKCAVMRIGTPAKKTGEDSDDEDQCALSDKWKYQHNIRRWSRKDLNSPDSDGQPLSPVKPSSSNDSLLTDQNSSSETGDSPVLDTKMRHNTPANDDYFGVKSSTPAESELVQRSLSPRLRRAASERIKGAKNFLKRMESFKSRKTRRIHRNGGNVEISGPVVTDKANMQEKIRHLNCKELSPSSETAPSPISGNTETTVVSADINLNNNTEESVPEPWSDDATNYKPLSKSVSSSESALLKEISDTSSAYLSANQDVTVATLSNSDTLPSNTTSSRRQLDSRLNQSDNDLTYFVLPSDHKPGSFPKVLKSGYLETEEGHGINLRTGSFNLGSEKPDINANTTPVKRRVSAGARVSANRASIYDNVEPEENLEHAHQELDMILQKLFQDINGLNKAIYGEDAEELSPPSSLHTSTATVTSPSPSGQLDTEGDDSLPGTDDHDVTSGTVSSTDSSDHDIHVEDLSHDDSAENIVCRERRDSGVGSSLTRAPSERRRYRIRWHSFQKSHRPSFGSRNHQISNLSICQIMVLQKLCLCRLTGLIEKYSPNRSGWTWSVPRFMKRHKVPDYSDKNVFGVPLLVTLQRTGQPLPQCMLHAMRYLRRTAKEAVGIFRKSGVRSRIQKLKNEVEGNPEMVNFEDLQAYDVADLLKQYFRELPECLLTNKLSEIFINIFIYLPLDQRVEALQTATVLLPDENREVLQSLLLFLADISQDASEHQMTASNLAVCFAPSLFNMSGTKCVTQSPSPRRARKNLAGVPDARELQEQKAAHECLTTMILECKKLFTIPNGMMSKCRFSYIEQGDPVSLDEFHKRSEDEDAGYQTYCENAIQALLKESRDKFKGWVSVSMATDVDVSYKKVADGHPLRLWKCSTEVEAPPEIVLDRVKDERHVWDEDLVRWSSLEKLDNCTEVFEYSRNSMAPHPCRDFCVLRSWRTDLPKGSCALISTSVEHPKVDLSGTIQGVILVSHFLIEPCGSGKSRITHISRVDMRGRTPEWYKKAYGHICVGLVERIRDSLKQTTEGPESVV